MTSRRANPAGSLQADRYLENTHCEGSVLLQLVVGAVLGLGGLPRQPVFVPPAAHVLERKTATSQEPGQQGQTHGTTRFGSTGDTRHLLAGDRQGPTPEPPVSLRS